MRKLFTILTITLIPLMLQSCIYEYPDCPPDAWRHLQISFDTSECPDANPEGMDLYLYPADGSGKWTFRFTELRGGEIDIPPGQYSLIAFNNDTYRTVVNYPDSYTRCSFSTPVGNVFEGLESLTRAAIPGGPPDGEETVIRPPQPMWCARIATVDVAEDGKVSVDGAEIPGNSYVDPYAPEGTEFHLPVISVPLRQAYSKVTVDIEGVENITAISRLCAVMTGMAAGYHCSELSPVGEAAAIPFAINRPSPDADSLTASLLTFGKKDHSRQSWLILYVWLTDGHRFYYKFNVTQQIDEAPDPSDIHLRLGPITVPESIGGGESGGGGMDVGVDGWDYVIIDMES